MVSKETRAFKTGIPRDIFNIGLILVLEKHIFLYISLLLFLLYFSIISYFIDTTIQRQIL